MDTLLEALIGSGYSQPENLTSERISTISYFVPLPEIKYKFL
jgi:hypothetical protein